MPDQVLPLVPPEEEFWSPYTGLDALCGSTLVISLDELVKEGLLEASDLPPIVADGTADFFAVCALLPPHLEAEVQLGCMPAHGLRAAAWLHANGCCSDEARLGSPGRP